MSELSTIVAVLTVTALGAAAAAMYFNDAIAISKNPYAGITNHWVGGFAAHAVLLIIVTAVLGSRAQGWPDWIFLILAAISPFIGCRPGIRLLTQPAADI